MRVYSGALVEDCVIFDNVDIGRRAKIRRAIVEKNAQIPADAVIGYDIEEDQKHYHVTESGIVVKATAPPCRSAASLSKGVRIKMAPVIVPTTPFNDQKPSTSGRRKKSTASRIMWRTSFNPSST